jgi:hypothetical protein
VIVEWVYSRYGACLLEELHIGWCLESVWFDTLEAEPQCSPVLLLSEALCPLSSRLIFFSVQLDLVAFTARSAIHS